MDGVDARAAIISVDIWENPTNTSPKACTKERSVKRSTKMLIVSLSLRFLAQCFPMSSSGGTWSGASGLRARRAIATSASNK